MKQRLITGAILTVILLPLIFIRPLYFYGIVGVFTLIASFEIVNMLKHKHFIPKGMMIYFGLATLTLYITLIALYVNLFVIESLLVWLFAVLLTGLLLHVFIEKLTSELLGKMILYMLYVGVSFAALSMVRSEGVYTLLYLLILSMVTDMFAYFVGVKFGKHRLAPKISPKKSIEGSIGGSFFAVLFASIFAYYFDILPFERIGIFIIVAIFTGLLVSITAQIGDLVASSFKRDHGIKDYSNIFPGHGGVLDRFDSSSFAAIALMIMFLIFGVL
ncbi:MAG: phosphatidate cytidylyltransferase [Candidatus Izemoplasmataceae bacterium]